MTAQTIPSGSTCTPGLPFQLPPGYQPSQFLYGSNGPWPSQPNDGNACKVAPEVLSDGPHGIPESEMVQYQKDLGTYYDNNALVFTESAISYSAELLGISLSFEDRVEITADIAAWYELGSPVAYGDYAGHYPELSDFSFANMIAHGLLSKLLSKLDPPDGVLLQGFPADPAREVWKCDLTHMLVVRKPVAGEYVAPSVVYLSRPNRPAPGQEYDFRVDAIRIFSQSQPGGPYDRWVLLAPGDGKAWQLAKYFALQGALVRVNLIDHPMVHFPSDAINAITKSTLPTDHLVLQLLLPHLLLSLPVDNKVLEGKYSLLNRTWTYPYSPYPAAGEEIRKVFPFYWQGSPPASDPTQTWATDRANAFPPYQFRTEPREVPSKYGTFLNSYYPTILTFAKGVVANIPDDSADWEAIRFWADCVASWIPGFPDGQAIYKNKELLARTCAMVIWNASIVHTADHWLMHQMFEQKLPTPYILRDPPPVERTPGVDPEYRPAVNLIRDVIPARLCDLMFFLPHCTTQLSEFKYAFANTLAPLIEGFRQNMVATDESLHQRFPEFGISLYPGPNKDPAKDCFAAGVQF
ncbi:MAG: hypothetical protein KGZ70_05865 [Hydrogenophaga sp.]|uniref:hypothetical protein n=1 Tax=Hydrogenophaga sp. TaxID=1904254 RepID=UPI001BC823DC|nr:hypothetical protein [Hydrogenophaga sp.]MBS3911347.1 hypothetical protein [Hydrogenophaga sp.]MDO9146640.1 hypothetical protein [Hydrogenophaga sp.]MDO9606354.1 hypothetical protein [Hydrogenophaga sp.]MDP2165536.1 hypothetical protein [Hydrogenophaga sp.]MDP3474642.1 hypothetical protein [Hydrogenophaga sp.]